jgi:hypothetical protein
MKDRADLNRYLVIFLLSTPAAVGVWFLFHGIYVSLTESERVVGYVDPLTQMGVYLGYLAMIAGTLVLAAVSAWSAFHLVRLLLQTRH